ncbi:MAG: hypothetical protein ACREOU_04865 [Candidatus Eiseniibacteriota bacterium]
MMKRIVLGVLGASCGLAWWGISVGLGERSYGILGSHVVIGAVSGVCTGVLMTLASIPIYRRLSATSLYWYSPLSVYLAIALYALIAFLIRIAINDFHPDQIRWAVGIESTLGMWWGVTFLLHVAVAVHLIAYGNHRLLRNFCQRAPTE